MTDLQPKLKISSGYIGGEAVGHEAILALVAIVLIVCATVLVRSFWRQRKA